MLRSELALDPALKMSYINICMYYVKNIRDGVYKHKRIWSRKCDYIG